MDDKKKDNDKKPPAGEEDGDKAQNSSTDKNFYKIYFPYFSRYLDGIINQKMRLVLWLIRNMTIANELKYSYREIAEKSSISYQTVAETMKTLMEKDFIRRANKKTLMINPRAVFRGRIDKKMGALNAYDRLDRPGTPKNMQTSGPSIADTKAISKELRELEEKKRRLQSEINSLELQLLFTTKEKPENGGESKDGTGQTSEQKHSPEEEEKDSAGRTTEQKHSLEEKEKDSAGQTSEPEIFFV